MDAQPGGAVRAGAERDVDPRGSVRARSNTPGRRLSTNTPQPVVPIRAGRDVVLVVRALRASSRPRAASAAARRGDRPRRAHSPRPYRLSVGSASRTRRRRYAAPGPRGRRQRRGEPRRGLGRQRQLQVAPPVDVEHERSADDLDQAQPSGVVPDQTRGRRRRCGRRTASTDRSCRRCRGRRPCRPGARPPEGRAACGRRARTSASSRRPRGRSRGAGAPGRGHRGVVAARAERDDQNESTGPHARRERSPFRGDVPRASRRRSGERRG